MVFSIKSEEKIKKGDIPIVKSDEVMVEVSNWYTDRYSRVIVQRNILFLLLILAFFVVIYSVYQSSSVASLYKLKPFVIQVNPTTGITNIVNPFQDERLTANQSMNQYFAVNYIKAREGYCSSDYKYYYLTVVRLFSSREVYDSFIKFIMNDPLSPLLVYGQNSCVHVKIRSVQFFNQKDANTDPLQNQNSSDNNIILVRFSLIDSKTNDVKAYKISSMEFAYKQMQLDSSEREINPLGFQVIKYRSDNEIINEK